MLHFKFSHQHDAMQCGASCLCMVGSFYGRKYSLRTVSKMCGVKNNGVSLLGIAEAAKKMGLAGIACRMSLDMLIRQNIPCIIHWNGNHFVFLYKIDGEKVYIADPAKGCVKYHIDDFKSHWLCTQANGEEAGIVMLLYPEYDINFLFKEEDSSEDRKSFRFLWTYVIQYKKYFSHIIVGLCLSSLLQLIMPYLTQSIVDIGIKHKDIGFIWLVLMGELMIVIGRTSSNFIRRWLLMHISMRVNISLVSDFL